MKRRIRWSLLMAVLGFILGLGCLLPLPSYETRMPASASSGSPHFDSADLEALDAPIDEPPDSLSERVTFTLPHLSSEKDYRADVLFDVHTIARGALTKNTDAYVGILYVDRKTKTEIQSIYYCHNYDFDHQTANESLSRYEARNKELRFPCLALSLKGLQRGVPLISAGSLGPVLTLATRDFDPKKGGTITGIFAHKLAKIGKNTYRRIDMKVTLGLRGAKITGPEGESFNWINLKMSEDFLNIPTGVQEFELLNHSKSVKKYPSNYFPRVRE